MGKKKAQIAIDKEVLLTAFVGLAVQLTGEHGETTASLAKLIGAAQTFDAGRALEKFHAQQGAIEEAQRQPDEPPVNVNVSRAGFLTRDQGGVVVATAHSSDSGDASRKGRLKAPRPNSTFVIDKAKPTR